MNNAGRALSRKFRLLLSMTFPRRLVVPHPAFRIRR
jgi:hypothetical protein